MMAEGEVRYGGFGWRVIVNGKWSTWTSFEMTLGPEVAFFKKRKVDKGFGGYEVEWLNFKWNM